LAFQSYNGVDPYMGYPTYPNFRYRDFVYDYRVNGGSFTRDDNINATVGIPGQSAVPEPSTYALFGLGALALVIAYRRKVA
jgi:hypothetical protein